MRKEDITVTTPEKSIIYAIGTRPESSYKVWADTRRENYYVENTHYTPGYVLEVRDSGFAVVLVADYHPDTVNASHSKQATALDALDYTLADHNKRMEVMAEYSHWPLSREQDEAKHEALAGLKAVPTCWRVSVIRTAYVRMLWADYQTRLDAAIGERKAERDERARARDDARFQKKIVVARLSSLGIGIEPDQVENVLNNSSLVGTLTLPTGVVKTLVEHYTKTMGA